MTEWVLIIAIYWYQSVDVVTIPGFRSPAQCQEAAQATVAGMSGGSSRVKVTCIAKNAVK